MVAEVSMTVELADYKKENISILQDITKDVFK